LDSLAFFFDRLRLTTANRIPRRDMLMKFIANVVFGTVLFGAIPALLGAHVTAQAVSAAALS